MNEDLEKIEEELREQEVANRKKQEMLVSGRSVFQIQEILNQKKDHTEKKK